VASTIRVKSIDTVYNGWAKVKRAVIDYRRRDGRWEEQTRELYDRGDGATIIPFDPARGTVLLVRQFRFVAHARGMDADLIEACAGLLDADDPETAIRREAEEELGYRLRSVRHLYTPLMSPGSVTERLSFSRRSIRPTTRCPTAVATLPKARISRWLKSASARRWRPWRTAGSSMPRPSCFCSI